MSKPGADSIAKEDARRVDSSCCPGCMGPRGHAAGSEGDREKPIVDRYSNSPHWLGTDILQVLSRETLCMCPSFPMPQGRKELSGCEVNKDVEGTFRSCSCGQWQGHTRRMAGLPIRGCTLRGRHTYGLLWPSHQPLPGLRGQTRSVVKLPRQAHRVCD